MKPPLIIYWARRDLRLTDNPALAAAASASKAGDVPLLPLFILEDYMLEAKPEYQFGYPSRWFMSEALPAFIENFPEFLLVQGKAVQYFLKLKERYEVTVFANDDVYADFYTQVDKLKQSGLKVIVCADALTISPDTRSGTGTIYSIFTPFKKAVWTSLTAKREIKRVDPQQFSYLARTEIAGCPDRVVASAEAIWRLFNKKRLLAVGKHVLNLDELNLPPKLAGWYVSEKEALARFEYFLESDELDNYHNNRDSLELDARQDESDGHAYSGKTSKMSLALAWGLVSTRTLVGLMQEYYGESFDNPFSARVSQGALTYISELIWREFYRYQLFHHPELMNTEFQARFRGTIDWVDDTEALRRFTAWIKGETGYGVVDAAMKQIATTGWMHNRSRMVVASILTKNFGVDWRWGQEYFRAALIDLDEASNNGGWQWGASVGADPKPIRIFNPELQAKNYDSSGAYQAKWLGGENILRRVQIPLIEHKVAREEALRRYRLEKVEPRDY